LVVGSGVAGLSFALQASQYADVIVASKREIDECNTRYAQGGIAAVLAPNDSFEQHISDTLIAGAGLCREDAVRTIVQEGPARIAALREIGVPFDQSSGDENSPLDLGREGGHSQRRIVHAADLTGKAVEIALVEACKQNPRIRMMPYHMGIDLITPSRFGARERCVGAYLLAQNGTAKDANPKVITVQSDFTVLATGGAGKVYLYTTNPDVATGDGVAMAYRAGATIANMEFFQFHPTCLYHPAAKNFLISEALRGEGAILRLPDGTPFMQNYDERKDLAPRDIVARSIDAEMKRTGCDYVLLDITHKPADFLRNRFPNIYAQCKTFGFDLTSEPIPVVPTAHFMCGGVATDLDGRTSLPGLYAVGEVACTGLHGANRLASNSVLEGLVMGYRCAKHIETKMSSRSPREPAPPWEPGRAVASDEAVVVAQNWDELRRAMWNYVGIVRTDKRLRRAANRIANLQDEIREYYWAHLVNRDLLELRNIATVAELIVACASVRRESRGLHYMLDAPNSVPSMARDTLIRRGVPAFLEGSG
jgi:L-aspartate oxidase